MRNRSHVRFQKWMFQDSGREFTCNRLCKKTEQGKIKMEKFGWVSSIMYCSLRGFPTLSKYVALGFWWMVTNAPQMTPHANTSQDSGSYHPSTASSPHYSSTQSSNCCRMNDAPVTTEVSQPHDTQNPSPTASEFPHCTYLQTNFSGIINLTTIVLCSKRNRASMCSSVPNWWMRLNRTFVGIEIPCNLNLCVIIP